MFYIKLNNEIVYEDCACDNAIIEFDKRSHDLVDKKVKNTILSLVKVFVDGTIQNIETVSWDNNYRDIYCYDHIIRTHRLNY